MSAFQVRANVVLFALSDVKSSFLTLFLLLHHHHICIGKLDPDKGLSPVAPFTNMV